MKRFFFFFISLTATILTLSAFLSSCTAANSLFAKERDITQITGDGAYCWFADPRALHFVSKDKTIDRTYLGWIDRKGHVMACQYDHKTKEQKTVVVREVFEMDDHDNPTFIALPDNRIMIFYMKHTSEKKIWYRISSKPGDITDLMEEKSLSTDHNTTYPSPFILSDDPNHIYLAWRGIQWHPTLAKLEMPTSSNNFTTKYVEGPYQILHSTAQNAGTQGTSCRPYAKYISDGKNRLYVAFSATHPDNINPTMLYAVYVDIRDLSVHDLNGKVLDDDLSNPPIFTVTNKETLSEKNGYVLADDRNIRHWIWDSALGKDNSYYVLFTKISDDKTKHSYYYGKWSDGKWSILKLADAGRWFHQNPTTEKCYSAGMAFDHNNPTIVYISVPVNNVYEIIRMDIADDVSKIIKTEQITKESDKNNFRPYVISGPESKDGFKLIWMHGDYYYWIIREPGKEKQGYYTDIRTNFAFPTSPR